MADINQNVAHDDETLLLVSGSKTSQNSKKYIDKLSKAILEVQAKHGIVKLRCVGAAALNNAEKAFIVARGEADKSGQDLVSRSYFTTVEFTDENNEVVEKTAILKEVVDESEE